MGERENWLEDCASYCRQVEDGPDPGVSKNDLAWPVDLLNRAVMLIAKLPEEA
jgi:hypothetical protein